MRVQREGMKRTEGIQWDKRQMYLLLSYRSKELQRLPFGERFPWKMGLELEILLQEIGYGKLTQTLRNQIPTSRQNSPSFAYTSTQ